MCLVTIALLIAVLSRCTIYFAGGMRDIDKNKKDETPRVKRGESTGGGERGGGERRGARFR